MLLIGTYTRNTASEGVYLLNDQFEQLAVFADIDNPSFLVKHPRLNLFYVVNEVHDFGTSPHGAVSCYELTAKGELKLLQQLDAMGGDPCHLCIDQGGQYLVVSNYRSGNFTVFPLDDEGRLQAFSSLVAHHGSSVDPMRQQSPHVHSATQGPGSDIYVADLGTDQLIRYPMSGTAQAMVESLHVATICPGAGPRHFCFDSEGKVGFLINELDNTVVSFSRDPESGWLTELQTISTLPADYDNASYCAHISLSCDDRFLYGSNRGHDSLAVFEHAGDGRLELVQIIETGGRHPRHFSLSPDESQLVVANRDDDNLVIFDRDAESGQLSRAGQVSVPAPVCVLFSQD